MKSEEARLLILSNIVKLSKSVLWKRERSNGPQIPVVVYQCESVSQNVMCFLPPEPWWVSYFRTLLSSLCQMVTYVLVLYISASLLPIQKGIIQV